MGAVYITVNYLFFLPGARSVICKIRKIQTTFVGRMMRKEEIEHLQLTGIVGGKVYRID